ncbi:GntR family transcriptional regulator [Pseudomonas sp. Ag1]|uniref:GntR family transcriptional regulator n=1 Tax=Pseudomonas sp. Ag1 TaxID=1197727 RepID=UPI000272CA19|nr:GntR family transcriptional regulator [Pseudomonas sp. Ag1]EJF69786.1 GntR family transcriptional regulator [Pseudomonas sp. Ag1]
MVSDHASSQTPDSRLPRYVQIRDDLAQRINQRTWATGIALPSEDKLAAEYSVSVSTMRKVLDALVQDGLVERIRGLGTFVSRSFERSSMLRFVRFRGTKGNELPTAQILAIKILPPPEKAAQQLRLAPGQTALYMHRCRSFGGEIVLVEHIWLPLPKFEKLPEYLEYNSPVLLYPVYESECDVLVARAVDDLTAQPLTDQDAKLFQLAQGTMAIQIERTMHDHVGAPVEWRLSYIPADRFHYTVEIK